MKRQPAQKNYASTQRFTEIQDILGNAVVFSTGLATLIIEVKATNFSLLSPEEQQAKMGSYATFLNSLSFPVQIVVQNKKLDISSYLKLLDEAAKVSQNKLLTDQMNFYRSFVANLVKDNSVLDKKFYIAISDFTSSPSPVLASKAESLHHQLKSINPSAKTLNKDELTRLFHELYSGQLSDNHKLEEAKTAFVKGAP